MSEYDYDVAIIGSGPSGIGAATALSNAGVKNVIVFERETHVGGIPRHTHHPSFGLLAFKRPLSGPKFIKALLKRCPDVLFKTSTTVLSISAGGKLEIAAPNGVKSIRARHIILATGARETPRHGRLVSGLRPLGVTTTGALQQFLYSEKLRPFDRPVVIGTELVSFSALWTLRAAGIQPVAMIEENPRITAYRPAALFARLMGIPIYRNTKITSMGDISKLKYIKIEDTQGTCQTLDCDGVIFSGQFVGDNTLARTSHLAMNSATQIPQMDQNWLTSDLAISVIGNATHPADMGDQCYLEGLDAGLSVAKILQTNPPSMHVIPITHGEGIKMTTPNMVRLSESGCTIIDLHIHVTRPFTGKITVNFGGQEIYKKNHRCMPARRIKLKNLKIIPTQNRQTPELHVSLNT